MRCPNPKRYDYDWVCLHPGEGVTAKQQLVGLFNGWLQPEEIRSARASGESQDTTEEQAEKLLRDLEEEASARLGMWRQTT